MQTTVLGRTGLTISRVALGAGPVSGLMTGDNRQLQQATLARAIQLGINWIDTAAGYGNGASESNLGNALRELEPVGANSLHVATKVRVDPDSTHDIRSQVMESVQASLTRLQRPQVTLLQLHNGLTEERGTEPASLSVEDVLRPGGVLDAMREVQTQGLTQFIGLTGTGQAQALRQVVRSGQFDTIQLPYNLLNPSAGQVMPEDFTERNYGNILADCLDQQMGVMAIRVLAAGAILGAPPSPHTLKTPYFPLALYERDRAQAAQLAVQLQNQLQTQLPSQSPQDALGNALARRALEFALAHPAVHCAIIGFGCPEQLTLCQR